jgi:hypothetical protein
MHNEFTITGQFQSLAGGHLTVTTDGDSGSLPIGDGRIDASFTAGRVTSVTGHDAAGRQAFEWEVPALPDGVGLFFSKNPTGSLKIATVESRQ